MPHELGHATATDCATTPEVGESLAISKFADAIAPLGDPLVPSWAWALAANREEARTELLTEGVKAVMQLSRGEDAGLVNAVILNAAALSASELRESVAVLIELVLSSLREEGFLHPARMWTFVPGIHDQMADDVNRYHVFNMGRYDAFTRWFGPSTGFESVLPAASAVGHFSDNLVISALGLRLPGLPIDNPRQTRAFAYSLAHGPRPPCFARAMLVRLPVGPRLLLSGTASIRGEASVHMGSLENQLSETFENIEQLLQSMREHETFKMSGIQTARVYFSRAGDWPAIRAGVSARLPVCAAVEYFPALICRAELLVELEATLAPSSS